MASVPTDPYIYLLQTYLARDVPDSDADIIEMTAFESSATYKVGMPVMLISNLSVDKNLVNGTMCKVVGLHDNKVAVLVDGKVHDIPYVSSTIGKRDGSGKFAERWMIALVVAFASTVHKLQSQSIIRLPI